MRQSLRRAVELEPSRADAAVPLARLLHARGERDEALRDARATCRGSFAADGLAARIELERAGTDAMLRSGPAPARGVRRARRRRHRARARPAADRCSRGRRPQGRPAPGVVGILDELGVDDPARPRLPPPPRRPRSTETERPRGSSASRRGSRHGSSASVSCWAAPSVLEAGHADAEQPHGPRRRRAAEQLERDRPDRAAELDRLAERPSARVGGEVVEAHLDPDRAAMHAAGARARAQLGRRAGRGSARAARDRRCRGRTSARAIRRSPCAPA